MKHISNWMTLSKLKNEDFNVCFIIILYIIFIFYTCNNYYHQLKKNLPQKQKSDIVKKKNS